MQPPKIPPYENARLTAVQALDILDTSAEERFDRITRIARRMFNVPFSVVTVVDTNRQWFKSCAGLDVQETPREVSFCAHAILNDQILVIPDTYEDNRFADNPLVIGEPFVRFYAGRPIKLPTTSPAEAHNMGTLCILDTKPRSMTKDDLDLLDDLAAMVESELYAHHAATIDELTQISNRRGFQLLGQKVLDYCQRYEEDACLVFIDLNDFKVINDTYGHKEGDIALSSFSQLLMDTCRGSDIVARLGGDEFVVLLLNTGSSGASILVDKVQENLEKINQINPKDYAVKFSYGVVEYHPDHHDQIDVLLEAGDALMYQCKQGYKK
jgi:diguanylate cyclase (GGDEF)-like protein